MINPIFTKKYSEDTFFKFVQELIPSLSLNKKKSEIRSGFKSIQQIAETRETNLDLVVFIANLESSINARVEITKNTYAVLKNHARSNALVAYISDDSSEWRFSLVTTKVTRTKDGIKETVSNPRRFSYVLGPTAKVATPSKMLQGAVSSIADLENKFSLEIVTKEFFENYKKLFDRLVDYLNKDHAFQAFGEKNRLSTENFAKKLLGQIVFLYFLQRKGWLGSKKGDSIANGDRNFMRSLFNKSLEDKRNFYNTYLEHLFYGALNQPAEKAGSYYRTYFECQIPFLNGGLFEPPQNYDWENEFLIIPDKLFAKDPSNSAQVDGILDTFDLYNFTVDESDFLDREVSVDPEMLGKVFENLLEENLRKGKGTYYTPREIVHYMCQESLINYLSSEIKTTDDYSIRSLVLFGEFNEQESPRMVVLNADNIDRLNDCLKKIKVVDPACGSGAFLIGMLKEIVKARIYLTYFQGKKVSEYDIKKETIQNCIYGVDIDPGAVDIAKLRLWLSLVVDYDLEDIEPLPNLDYKIMVGNSLIEKLHTKFLDRGVDDKKNIFIEELNRLKQQYFITADPKTKSGFRIQINNLIRLLVNYDNEQERNKVWDQILDKKNQLKMFTFDGEQQSFDDVGSYTQKLDSLKDLTESDHFEWHLNFNEVFDNKGFDIAIANPPYGADIDKLTKLLARLYPNTTKSFKDIYKIFIELGVSKLIKQGGTLCYIVPNTLLLQPRYKDAREYLLKHRIIEILNLGEKVFDQVVVPTCVIFIQNEATKNNTVKFQDLSNNSVFKGELINLQHKKIKQSIYQDSPSSAFVESFRVAKAGEQFLEDILDFKDAGINYQRVKVGLKEKGKSNLGQRLLYEGLKSNSEDVEYWKGEDIKSYFIASKTGRFVKLSTLNNLAANERVVLNKDYFAVAPKIIWRQTAPCLIASLDERGIWFGRSIQAGVIKESQKENYDIKYLLAILNSKYLKHIYSQLTQEGGRVFPQVKLDKLKNLPIKILFTAQQEPFVEIINKILLITKTDDYLVNTSKNKQVEAYAKQIDQMVYELYNLTTEEINNIQNSLGEI